jgi:hypothetical protein
MLFVRLSLIRGENPATRALCTIYVLLLMVPVDTLTITYGRTYDV